MAERTYTAPVMARAKTVAAVAYIFEICAAFRLESAKSNLIGGYVVISK